MIRAIIILILLSSCSAKWHLKQAQKKDPSIFQSDTLILRDTIYTQESRIETVFKPGKDTTIIKEGKLTIKYFKKDSLVYLSGKCESDTIVKENTVIKTVYKERDWSLPNWVKFLLILIPVLLGLILVIKKL